MLRIVLSICFWLGVAAPQAMAERIVVFAAASLSGVIEDIAQDPDVVVSYGGSGAIARQITAGAPADLVVLANPAWMSWLVDQGTVRASDVLVVAGNSLVVVAPNGTQVLDQASELRARLGKDRLAMGQRDAVPAGAYAKQWLTAQDLWEPLKDQLAETDNVRAALALVARGQVPFGVVYASDAKAQPAVDVVFQVSQQAHDPIRYPAAALSSKGAALLAKMRSPQGMRVFAAHGFQRPAP